MSALGDLLTDLAACLCAELTPEGEADPGLCFCGVFPGNQTPIEITQCDEACGQAWVRLTSAYPAISAGVLPEEGRTGCGTFLGADIDVGVIRCLEYPADGSPPEPEAYEAATLQQMDDLVAMRKAISCCPALDNYDYELLTYTPHGPAGMIVGGAWSLSVAI